MTIKFIDGDFGNTFFVVLTSGGFYVEYAVNNISFLFYLPPFEMTRSMLYFIPVLPNILLPDSNHGTTTAMAN